MDVRTVNEHLINVYETAELDRERTIRKIRIVRTEGTRDVAREIDHSSRDAIISVGYWVNTGEASQCQIWATGTLREFITNGFVFNDERLQLNVRFGRDYFVELLERIREIRTSERRFYLKITDLYEAAASMTTRTPYSPASSSKRSRRSTCGRFPSKPPPRTYRRPSRRRASSHGADQLEKTAPIAS